MWKNKYGCQILKNSDCQLTPTVLLQKQMWLQYKEYLSDQKSDRTTLAVGVKYVCFQNYGISRNPNSLIDVSSMWDI